MNLKRYIFLFPALLAILAANGATPREDIYENPNRAGGVYYAYPEPEGRLTPAPRGYEPFYISHYGRHGSRYLISDEDYTRVSGVLHAAKEAGALTPVGIDVCDRIDSLMIETAKRGGDLTPLGVRQHRGITERMFNNYPQVFRGSPEISARSTVVIRCILSMTSFVERLKELNPKIKTTVESSARYMDYLNYHSPESSEFTSGPWVNERKNYEERKIDPSRIISLLFSNPEYADRFVNKKELYWGLYWIAVDEQNIETRLGFMDLFTHEELYSLWVACNFNNYVCDANYAGSNGLVVNNAENLLENIIRTADEAILSGKNSATLRFGHDGNLQPLAAILEMGDCGVSVNVPIDSVPDYWANYRVSPMAGNVQLIFYRNSKAEKILVKFLLNEIEQKLPIPAEEGPYYDWSKVKAYYLSRHPGITE